MTKPLRAGTTLVLMGDRVRVLATAAEPGGALTALQVTALGQVPPGPPPPELVERVLALATEHGMTMFPAPAG